MAVRIVVPVQKRETMQIIMNQNMILVWIREKLLPTWTEHSQVDGEMKIRVVKITSCEVVSTKPLPLDRPSTTLVAKVIGMASSNEYLRCLLRKWKHWLISVLSVLQQH